MAAKSNTGAADPLKREVTITRVIDAPRTLVYKAWTDPKQLARWWGPRVFTNPVCELDVRPGGALRIVMRAPDGTDYPMIGVFNEVIEPERLVFTSTARDANGVALLESVATVTFEDLSGKTRLTVHASAVGFVPIAAHMLAGMEAGWTQSIDKLTDQTANTAGREIVSTRVFDAPRELVFKAWTDPNILKVWWGPKGFTNTFEKFDMRPGGEWIFVMHGPDGANYPNRIVFLEIAAPKRIVLDHTTNPHFVVTADFVDLGGKTKVSYVMTFDSKAACDGIRPIAENGNKGMFDRLAQRLVKMAGG